MRYVRAAAILFAVLVLTATAFADVRVKAYLYNPKKDSAAFTVPYQQGSKTEEYHPYLVIAGIGLPDGEVRVTYSIESGGKALCDSSFTGTVKKGAFAQEVKLDKRYPSAEQVRWELKGQDIPPVNGVAPLRWSRFHGKVVFKNPQDASDVSIDLQPIGFNAPGYINIPVEKDGSFDEIVPARIYHVMNVCGTGYAYNCMERWGWDYDLTGDREDEFTIGRTELYSIRAFDIIGGPPTLVVAFRPSALSRILRFDKDGNGRVEGSERNAMGEALKHSCTAIGPELTAENVKIWIDGKPHPVLSLTQIPEYDGYDLYQVMYIAQVYPADGRLYGASHEIKVEVESEEELNGKKIRDFGQGSVGFYPAGYYQDLF
ncbi:hypothetical protein LLG96_04110 [bacterium]|nr:hypothetical protein [bacterium]